MSVAVGMARANGLYNHFTGRKKWTLECGVCHHIWIEKVPIREHCSAVCPCCRTQNLWSISEFERAYRQQNGR